MRFAILSDIHSNLEALTSVFEVLRDQNIGDIVCLGDIVGYGANPNECVALVREHCRVSLLGNHDLAAVDPSVADFFNMHAREAALWTAENLSAENKQYLQELPYTAVVEGARLVHSSPSEPEAWHYIVSLLDARPMFRFFSESICFVGHSHVPGVFAEASLTGRVNRTERFLVNVGSVGQPRDGDPRSSFGIFDTDRWEYVNLRIDYDVESAMRKIREAGLPRKLADRLAAGV